VRVAVITISDRASRGQYADLSGPAVEKEVRALFPAAEIARSLVPDEPVEILRALQEHAGCDFILTTGGTGISSRDVTPEVTMGYCDKEIPGIAEALRAAAVAETPAAMLSRGFAGLRGTTVIVNFPGSVAAVTSCMKVLGPVMEHAVRMLKGEGH
jgi:molybdopterin adenylyltransferase